MEYLIDPTGPATLLTETSSSRVWCLVSSSSHNDLQVKEIAGYALSLLRPGADAAVLPADSGTKDFAEFCREILGIKEEQLVWVPTQAPYITSRDLDAGTASKVREFVGQQQRQQRHGQDTISTLQPGEQPHQQQQLQQQEDAQDRSSDCYLVPYGVTPALQQWMAQNQLVLPILCDDARLGHKGMLHRHVRQLERPSKIESLNPDIATPKGYSCSSVDDLLVAFRLIGRKEAVVKPLYGKEGQGVLFVSSPEELRLYDFPLGDVVLEEALVMDKGDDGIPVSATHLTLGQKLIGAYEKICIGTVKFGMRSVQAPSQFERTIQSWTSQITSLLQPAGPGYFHYASIEGQPVLLGVRLGQLSAEHFAAIFRQQHAPDSMFYCWTVTLPHSSLDIWTFWSRLQEHGAAFTPADAANKAAATARASQSASGVFPLLFLKGSTATLIAVGADREQVATLRQLADACLREPVAEQTELELVSWREDVRRIWASGPRPEYRRQTQRYNLSNRCIPLVRKGLDVIILPGGHEGTREFASFCRDVLELGEEQIIFTSGNHYNLDDDVDEAVLSKVKAMLISHPGDKFTLVPYAVTPNFQRWASQLSEFGVSVFGESLDWIQQYGHKGILHRSMAALDQPSVLEQINPKIRVPRGYYCETSQQLLDAYKLLGLKDVVLKPVFGAAGEGILFVHDEQELALYDFPMGGVCLEEFLQLDRAPDGIILSPAVHYMEGQLLGQGLVDQIMVGTTYSGWRPSVVSKAFAHTAVKVANDILRATKPRGPGGFDFLSVGGKPLLTDVNTGRFNGAHSPKLFVELYAPQQKFYVWKQKPPERATVWQFWQKLQAAGVAFWPGKDTRGVFPMIFLPGLSGQFIAIADTEEEAQALKPLAEACITAPSRSKPSAITQKYSLFKRADIVRKALLRRIWCLSPLNSKFVSSFNVSQLTPLHAAALLRPGVDVIVLPSRPDVREFFGFVKATTGLLEGQVIWTSGRTNCLHTDIDSDVVEQLKSLIRSTNLPADTTAGATGATAAAQPSLFESATEPPPAATPVVGSKHHRQQQPPQQQLQSKLNGSSSRGASAANVREPAGGLTTTSRSTSWISPSVHVATRTVRLSSAAVAAHNCSQNEGYAGNGSCGSSTTSSSSKPGVSSSSSASQWTVIPDTPSSSFQKWAGPLVEEGVTLFADLPDWMAQYGHKGIMHQYIKHATAARTSHEPVTLPAPATTAAAVAAEASELDGTSNSSRRTSETGSTVTTLLQLAESRRSSTDLTHAAVNTAAIAAAGAAATPAVAAAANGATTAAASTATAAVAAATVATSAAATATGNNAADAAGGSRSSSKADVPCRLDGILEDLQHMVYVPRGYICSNTQDLQQAYDILGCVTVTLKPIRGGASPGEGALRCSSRMELCYYDFPLGDVILQEELQLDCAPDGLLLLPRLPYLGGDRVGTVIDMLLVGDQIGGYRSSCLPAEVQAQLAEVSARFLDKVQPRGAGALSFGLSKGNLVLLGAQMGTFVPEHFIKMFMERWAEDAAYFCWHYVAPKELDVWQFWARLMQAEVAFKPGASTSGVYPLIYLPGVMGTFIAISVEESELAGLREAATAALTTPVAAAGPGQLPLAGWSEADRRIYVTGPARHSSQQALKYVLPVRGLPLVRRSRDVVVLPGNHEPTAEFASWARRLLGLSADQVVYTQGQSYAMDEDLSAGGDTVVLSSLKELVVTSCDPWVFVPLHPTTSFETWAGPFQELGVRVVADAAGSRFASKAILHRMASAPGVPSVIEQIDPDIQVPRGYICSSVSELLTAYQLLLPPQGSPMSTSALTPFGHMQQEQQPGSPPPPMLLKPLTGCGEGEGLLVVSDEDQLKLYDFLDSEQVVLQELLTLDRAPDGIVLSLAVPFAAGVVLTGCVMDEIILDTKHFGFRPSEAPRRFKQKATRITQELLHAMDGVVMGTFYFVSVKGEPVLMSYQSGSCSDLHAVRLFVQQHAPPDSCFYSWRFKPPLGVGVQRFWDHLKAKGLAFEPGSGKVKGIFPLCYLRGLEAQLVAVGTSALDCCLLQDKAKRSIDHAFRRSAVKQPPMGGPQGSSPQPAPPLDGSNVLQPPALALGPPAAALGVLPASNGSSNAVRADRQGFAGVSQSFTWGLGSSSPPVGISPAGSLVGDFLGGSRPFGGGLGRKPQLDLTLLANAEGVYGPVLLEERNVLIAGGKVVGLLDEDAAEELKAAVRGLQVLDCSGCLIAPGFVDCHVHITGGGGEAGPASRCPAARLSEFIDSGVTCVVGLLGTDDISRSNEELIIKARALNEEGITAFTWIGSYHAPPATVTGSIRGDMCLVDSALGVGELAIADHRGSQLGPADVARIAAEARVGGMLSGKAGLVHIHVGPGASGLQVLRDAVACSDIPLTQFHPTHMDRSEELINQGAQWLLDGGSLDFTVRSIKARWALQQYYQAGVPLQNVTVSSDAFGSLPSYDSDGKLVKYTVADGKALLRFLRSMYFQEHWPLERILPLMTSNPARLLKLRHKGSIAVGADADLLLLSHDTLQLRWVYAKGVMMKSPQWTQGGFLEKGSKLRPYAAMNERNKM